MSLRTASARRLGTALALPLLAACAPYRTYETSDLKPRDNVRLVADSGFLMHAQVFNNTTQLQETCRLTHANGTLDRVSADTIWLATVSGARPVIGESDACRHLARGFTVRAGSAAPNVSATRFEPRRARNAVLWATVIGAVLLWWVTVSFEEVQDAH